MLQSLSRYIKLLVFTILLSISCTIYASTIVLATPNEFMPRESRQWDQIGQFLITTDYTVYVLNWFGFGGRIDLEERFVQYIRYAQNQGKHIIIRLVGPAYSAHALAACTADEVVIGNPLVYLMYHADSYDSKHRVLESESSILDNLEICKNKGILTTQDLGKLWQGYEVYVSGKTKWYQPDERPPI